jgi:hypothetical protein
MQFCNFVKIESVHISQKQNVMADFYICIRLHASSHNVVILYMR